MRSKAFAKTGAEIAAWIPAILLVVMSVSMLLTVVTQLPLLFETQRRIITETQVVSRGESVVRGLQEARDHARTDQFTEQYARVIMRLGRPGELAVRVAGSDERTRNWIDDFLAE